MVGDSITDVLTARATRVPVVAVSFGYTQTPAAELGADVLIHHFDELGAPSTLYSLARRPEPSTGFAPRAHPRP